MNNLKLVFTLVLLLFASSVVTAQRKSKKKRKRTRAPKVEWILNYKDGSTATGELVGFYTSQTKLNFKNRKTGKKEKIKGDKLKSIVFKSDSEELVFERITYKYLGLRKQVKGKDKFWAAKVAGNDKIEGYVLFTQDASIGSNPHGGGVTHNHYITRSQAIRILPNDYIFYIGMLSTVENDPFDTLESAMNKRLKIYLKDYCPDFASTIENRTYKVEEIEKILEDYASNCK